LPVTKTDPEFYNFDPNGIRHLVKRYCNVWQVAYHTLLRALSPLGVAERVGSLVEDPTRDPTGVKAMEFVATFQQDRATKSRPPTGHPHPHAQGYRQGYPQITELKRTLTSFFCLNRRTGTSSFGDLATS
jgi:hypothetical protein